MTQFTVKSHIKHDAKLYQPGETIELNKKQAEAVGMAVEAPAAKSEAPSKGEAQFVALKDFQYQGEKFKEGETYTFDSATALAVGAERIRPATED